jgi:serine/threonine protein kinase
LDANKNIKIIDFGFSESAGSKKNHFCGTPSYMSPEVILKQDHNGMASDIWSCGVIFYVLLTGQFPFKSPFEKELFKSICKGKITYPDFISENTRLFLEQTLIVDQRKRPAGSKILKSEFLNSSSMGHPSSSPA